MASRAVVRAIKVMSALKLPKAAQTAITKDKNIK
jgi:hypothetical protein